MGQVGAALGNKTTFEKDPQDFSGAEWGARAIGGAGQGLAKGFQNYQQQNQMMRQPTGGAPIQTPQQPQVDLSAAVGQNPMAPRRPQNPYFYGYGS